MTSGKKKSSTPRKSRKTPIPGTPTGSSTETPDPDASSPVEKIDESAPSAKVDRIDDSSPSAKVDVDSTSFAKADPRDIADVSAESTTRESKPTTDSSTTRASNPTIDSEPPTDSNPPTESKPTPIVESKPTVVEATPVVDEKPVVEKPVVEAKPVDEAKPVEDKPLFEPIVVAKPDESTPVPKTEIDDNLTSKASPPPVPEPVEALPVIDTRPKESDETVGDRRSRPPRALSVRPSDDNAFLPSPEWMLGEPEKAPDAASPAVSQQIPVVLSASAHMDPKTAALEAARIVGEIVGDVESAGGAAIVAAAAAGAAIEAARARAQAQFEGREVIPASEPPISAEGATSSDPVVTVRMQRDRILRALAEDVAAQAEAQQAQQAQQAPGQAPGERAPSTPGSRAPSTPGRPQSQATPGVKETESQPTPPDPDEQPPQEEELDAVQIAAAAIQRLRKRASTDLAELKTQYHRHDILVLFLAFVIIIVAGRVHRGMVTPPTTKFAERGLVFEHSTAWLSPEPIPSPAPRIAYGLTPQSPVAPPTLYHVELTSSLDPNAKLEVLIDRKPGWSNIVTGLELDRRTRWGELYTLDDSSVRSIAGHDWLRTAYRYAHVADKGDEPRVGRAIEYATIDREQIYVVTMFGGEAELARIEDVVAGSLHVPTQTGLPLVPQTRTLSQRTYPNAVARAFDSTVMVVVADLVDGRLRPRGGGSGVVVGSDGSILTNYHVIHDKDGRLHDVFVIGRFSQPDHAPQLWCAGRPSRSKLQRELDLALVKCDLDLDGRAWVPAAASVWPTLPEARTADIKMGQRLWVLGYPDVGGGGLTLSEGSVEGWTGENGTVGKDFIKTDASITHGNSGGPVVDDHGRLVGIAAAFRTRVNAGGGVLETAQVGLVRPLSTASDLLAIAQTGWTPREGHTDVDLQPSGVEAPGEGGVRISTKVLDAANETPVRDALVMILRPGVDAKKVDVNRLDDQVLSWGRSNTQGEVQLKQPVPVPGTYSVMIVARGYEPLVGESELHLDAKTPAYFDPWGKIWLRSR